MKDCKHKLDWNKVWLPAKLYKEPHGFLGDHPRYMPISKYWRRACIKCGKEISEEQLPYESQEKMITK